MKKQIIIPFLFIYSFVSAQQNEFKWEGTITSTNNEVLKFVPVQIETKDKYFMFMSDEFGKIDINYNEYFNTDTLVIASLGYNIKKIACKKLLQTKQIVLEKTDYLIKEVIVSKHKIKYEKLGNLYEHTLNSTNSCFNTINALYIPSDGLVGKIKGVRIYMKIISDKESKYRPFRLHLYKGDKVVGEELIKKELIVSLNPKGKRNWAEIDLSMFDIDLPKEGVFVAIETLSPEFYKKNGYIKTETTGRYNACNSIAIGWTRKTKSNSNIKSLYCAHTHANWYPSKSFKNYYYYLMQIVVKPYE